MATALSTTTPIQVLVVEDHEALLDVTIETLAAQGHEVEGISSAEALDELPTHFVADTAVLDIHLPGEDGLSLARRLGNSKNPSMSKARPSWKSWSHGRETS